MNNVAKKSLEQMEYEVHSIKDKKVSKTGEV